MPLLTRLRSAWRTVAGGRQPARDLDAEVEAFVDELAERFVARGLTPDAARRAARMEAGGPEQVKEAVRDIRIGRLLDETLRDAVHAWRGFRRAPGFTATALVTLALGVGANAAIFSVARALLLQPLPFRDPGRLLFVWADQTAEGFPRAPLSGPELQDLDERSTAFDGFGAIWATTAALTGEDDPEQLRVGLVTTDFFSLLGAEAALGRTFHADDAVIGPPGSVLLSDAVWRRRYGADPTIVGRRIDVNGVPTSVVGIMPAGFRTMMPPDAAVPDDLEAWLPLSRRYPEGPRGQRYLRVIGRMRPGVSVPDGQADIARVGREISQAYAFYGAAGRQFETVPLHLDAMNDVRRPLMVLAIGVGILLSIACVNVAGLFVARAAARTHETAVRAALGAGAGRLVRQSLVEVLLLAVMGAALGLVTGQWGLSLLKASTPDALGRLRLATLDAGAFAVSTAIVVFWMAVLALVSVSGTTTADLRRWLRLDGHRATQGVGRRLRAALTVAQVALSVVLVVGAVLLIRTLINVQNVDPGFRSPGILSFRVALPPSRYPNQDAFNAFSRRLQEALANLPAATGASAVSHVPYDHVPNWGGPYVATEGADPSTAPQADYRALAPGLVELLGVRLVEGRTFTEQDDHQHERVVLVDDRLARRTWPGQSAVGRRLAADPTVTGEPTTWATVVGVVSHVRHRSPIEEVREQIYFPERQVPRNPAVYLIGTDGDPARLVPLVRDAVHSLDPALPIYDVRPLSDYVDEVNALRRFTTMLAVLFAVTALVLASVGLYGVVAHSVAARQREFGVRVALGARARHILGLVVGEGALLAVIGSGIGVIAGAGAAWWLRSQLFGVTPWDPLTLGLTAPVLGLSVLAACALPARRAVSASPAATLRRE